MYVSKNPFQPLEKEKGPVTEETSERKTESTAEKGKELVIPIVTPMEEPGSSMAVDGDEEMDLGELDLDELEKECDKKGKGYISRRQLELLQEAIVRSKASHQLGIASDPQKGSKRKPPEEELKRGRKSNKQRIAEIGVKLIESGQYPTIKAAFSEVSKVIQ